MPEPSPNKISTALPFSFDITHQSTTSNARCGLLTTPHGTLETPAFIFCATKAAIKGLGGHELKALGASIILSNTYHLMLQPGADAVEKAGGLHQFMGWDGPMLTDSGGFQVFSLGHGGVAQEIKGSNRLLPKQVQNISEEGVVFTSYLTGDRLLLTPEKSMEIQQKLGADLIVTFDECTPFHVPQSYTAASTRRSMRWSERCLDHFQKTSTGRQALYGVIQGGTYADLRQESAQHAASLPLFGQAIGGSLGQDATQMTDVVALTMQHLPREKPTHLLGIGRLQDIVTQLRHGIDTFDCVHPTRLARHGGALVWPASLAHLAPTPPQDPPKKEHLNLKNARFALDDRPIDNTCLCPTCRHFSRRYLHHLFKAKEILGAVALTRHNIFFMCSFFSVLRTLIQKKKI